MTTRHLKIDGAWVMGKNGKKIRYLFNKDEKTIILKVPDNWTKNAYDDITDKYDGYTISDDVVKKRGRPKKVQRKEKNNTKFASAATHGHPKSTTSTPSASSASNLCPHQADPTNCARASVAHVLSVTLRQLKFTKEVYRKLMRNMRTDAIVNQWSTTRTPTAPLVPFC